MATMYTMDKLTKIINLMAMDRCSKAMGHSIWEYFCTEKLMAKELSFLVTALFTREISSITLLVQSRVIFNRISLSITEGLRIILLMEMAKKKEEITNLSARLNRATKCKAYLYGMKIHKNIHTKDRSILIINFMVRVEIR